MAKQPLKDYQITIVAVWMQNGQEHTFEYDPKFYRKGVSPEQAASRFKFSMTNSQATPPPGSDLQEWLKTRGNIKSFINKFRSDLQEVGVNGNMINFKFIAKEVDINPKFPKPLPPKPNPQLNLPLPKSKPKIKQQLDLFKDRPASQVFHLKKQASGELSMKYITQNTQEKHMQKTSSVQEIVGSPTIRLAFSPVDLAPKEVTPAPKKVEKGGGEKDAVKEKQVKRNDLIRVFLDCVPSLEDAKEDFQTVLQSLQNPEVQSQVEGYLAQIEEIQVSVLELTKGVIQEGRTPAISLEKKESPITADMIAGKTPIKPLEATTKTELTKEAQLATTPGQAGAVNAVQTTNPDKNIMGNPLSQEGFAMFRCVACGSSEKVANSNLNNVKESKCPKCGGKMSLDMNNSAPSSFAPQMDSRRMVSNTAATKIQLTKEAQAPANVMPQAQPQISLSALEAAVNKLADPTLMNWFGKLKNQANAGVDVKNALWQLQNALNGNRQSMQWCQQQSGGQAIPIQ